MNEAQIALEVGLMGRTRAVPFLLSLLQRCQGNVSQMSRTLAGDETPAAPMSADEDKSTDEKAIKDWNAPSPESIHEKAVNYIFAHNGCLSGDVKKAMIQQGSTKNQWAYTLKTLGNERRLRKDGDRVHLRWFKAT